MTEPAPSKTAIIRMMMPKLMQIRSTMLKLAELWRYNSQQKLITYQAPLLLEYHPLPTISSYNPPDIWMTSVILEDLSRLFQDEIYPRPYWRDGDRYREMRLCSKCHKMHC